jgi:hypothetical protein
MSNLKAQDPDSVQHHCDTPSVALCGVDLDPKGDGSFDRFYRNCTNSFAAITCRECQRVLYDRDLAPGGFTAPDEWKLGARRGRFLVHLMATRYLRYWIHPKRFIFHRGEQGGNGESWQLRLGVLMIRCFKKGNEK